LRILIITQYFWPENFRINEVSEELVNLGHDVFILTGYPNYPKGEIYSEFKKDPKKFSQYKNAKIIRVPLLARKKNKISLISNYVSFLLNSIVFGYFKLKGKKIDIIFTCQLSPVTIGVTSAFFSKILNIPHIFWVQDLWPDTLVALKILKKNWQIKLFKIFVNWIYSRCDLILAQSKNILKEINKYPSVRDNIYYFPTWGESDLFLEVASLAPEIKPKEIFTILFAGNIGEAQDFPNLIKAVQNLVLNKVVNFRMIIIGDGSKKEWAICEVKKLNIEKFFEFYNSYPLDRMPSFFRHADALLVSLLNKKVFNMTVPGKLQFYLSSGIPIIGNICGEGAEVIKKSKSGLVCDSGDYKTLSKIISKMIKLDKMTLKKMGLNGQKYALKEFSKTKLVNKLNKILISQVKKKLNKSEK
tara:strand:+ start:84 stop:1328 length:1245 start_codon:yes stop_codon:yes gene_type:complete